MHTESDTEAGTESGTGSHTGSGSGDGNRPVGEPQQEAPEPLQLAGVLLTPVPRRPHTWSYRATRVELAPSGEGTGRQLSLVEAGAFAMLSLTTQLAPQPAELESARQALAQRTGTSASGVRLVPEQLDVHSAALLVGDGGATFEPLATGTTSGAPPHTAVLSSVLDAAQLARVKSGLRGERGRLAVRYEFTPRRDPETSTRTTGTSSTEESSTVVVRGPGAEAVVDRTTGTHEHHSHSTSTLLPSRPPAPVVEAVQTDAADWRLRDH